MLIERHWSRATFLHRESDKTFTDRGLKCQKPEQIVVNEKHETLNKISCSSWWIEVTSSDYAFIVTLWLSKWPLGSLCSKVNINSFAGKNLITFIFQSCLTGTQWNFKAGVWRWIVFFFLFHYSFLPCPWGRGIRSPSATQRDAFEHHFWPEGWDFDQMNIENILCPKGLPWGTDVEVSNWLIHLINENEFKNAGLKLVKIMFSNNSTAQNIGHWKSSKDSYKKFPQKFCSKSSNSMPADLIKNIQSTMEQ